MNTSTTFDQAQANYGFDPDVFVPEQVILTNYRVVSIRPLHDPLKISRTVVTAPGPRVAVEHLIDAAGFPNKAKAKAVIDSDYKVVFDSLARQTDFAGTEDEWVQAIQTGALPSNVLFPEGSVCDPAKSWNAPVQFEAPRLSLMARIEGFFERQARYRRTWKAIGILVAIGAVVGAIWVLWQAIVGLFVLSIAAKAFGAGLRGR